MKASHFLLGAAGLALGLTLSLDAAAQTCNPPRILFVVDASSSMRNTVTEGSTTVTKWAAAQSAVETVLSTFGDAAQYGLMTFPTSSGACSTGEIDVEVGVNKSTEILAHLNGINLNISRHTPAGQSLMAASKYAAITDPAYDNYVIFLSDGWQYCSIPTPTAPVCVSSQDCGSMGVSPCPTCNSCQQSDSDPACSGQSAHGCFCVRTWPVLGVEALADAGVTTYVVGFGSQVDFKTLNQAADKGGTALTGCDPNSDVASCYYQATAPSQLNDALEDIVQKVVVDSCNGPCGIPGERTCTAAGWSDCIAPDTIECTSECGTTGTQKCVNGSLTPCDAQCPDAGAGGSAGSAGEAGAGGEGATGGAGGAGGAGGQAASGGAAGQAASGGSGGTSPQPDAGVGDSGLVIEPDPDTGDDGGCSCRVGSSAPSGGLAALFAALAALGLIRRKR